MQVFVILLLVATLLYLAMQVYRRRRLQHLPVTITNTGCMTGSGALMIWQLSDYYISIHAIHEPGTVGYTGFPYCVLMYTIAFLANIAVLIVFIVEVYRQHRQQASQDLLSGSKGTTTTNDVINHSDANSGMHNRFR